ncbi:MAG: nucleotidyltransferase domain-containing protein [Rhodospirillaceae bacterium]|nr:nucleotidyltransferase domain-containing protein [Rhodospirillaceae bacterium]MCY4066024.1 nucleotidyltransferase domain-containing protein [Rhodospirillaceae bacterium]
MADAKAAPGTTATVARRDTGRRLDAATLDDIVRRVVAACRPRKIVLFGSAARGEMGLHSDVDLLVVKDYGKDWRERKRIYDSIYRELYGVPVAIDVIVATPGDVQRYRNSHSLVFKPALRDGRTVYDAA